MDKKIKIVDARMGRGKSTAAIQYIEDHKDEMRFLYITPYLSEVSRVCESCDLKEPGNTIDDGDEEAPDVEAEQIVPKSVVLKEYLRHGKSVAATHALFYLIDDEALEMIREKHYCLIIDEEINIIEKVGITNKDYYLLKKHLTTTDETGRMIWTDEEYIGKLAWYKRMIESGSIYQEDVCMISVMSPELLKAFDDVLILTYRFEGSKLEAYMQLFGFEHEMYGIEIRDGKRYFVPGRDKAPAEDLGQLIHLEKDAAFNRPGEDTFSLSKVWYQNIEYDDENLAVLRKNMMNFLRRNRSKNARNERMWTCFKDGREKLIQKNGACSKNWVPLNIKATNKYRNCTHLAYMVNRFEDPNIMKFFAKRGIKLDRDSIALSEMIQWIWRSAIRDGKPIYLYVPSYRMRELLYGWMQEIKRGDNNE